MTLPWVRLDTGFPTHDKVLDLVAEYGERGRAAGFVYLCGLAYSGGAETDGLIPYSAMPVIHGTKGHGERLVEVGLWVPDQSGWRMNNFGVRNQTKAETEKIRAKQSAGAKLANCKRWHAADCRCWADGDVSRPKRLASVD